MTGLKRVCTLWIWILASLAAAAQVDTCSCVKKETTTVCHLSVQEYCYGLDGCQHSLDGDFMRNSLALKLRNLNNFGETGVSECAMNLKKLTKIKSVTDITDAGCDIFFTGSFAVDTFLLTVNSDKTSVPDPVLNAIRSWSMLCDRNLVIVSQAEAKPWGYTIRDENVNPNQAITDPSKFSIFNGVFGSLSEFQQGGTYQGVIVAQPATGVEILSQDANGRPTVAFDVATRDLILGDIGILCNPAGFLSQGNQIKTTNDNDKLAGNLFALGCQIGQGNKYTEETYYKCRGEALTLPNGQVVISEAIFVDSFITSKGCDSFHFAKVIDYEEANLFIAENRCTGDSFRIMAGNILFDESYPEGTVRLIDRHGCDSIIHVNLNYFANTSFQFTDTVCKYSGFSYFVGEDTYSEVRPAGTTVIRNMNGCDSTVTVSIHFLSPDTTLIKTTLCANDSLAYEDKFLSPGKIYNYRYKSLNPCDSIVFIDLSAFPLPKVNVDTIVEIDQYKPYLFQNQIPDDVSVSWTYLSGLSCTSCPNPLYKPGDYPAFFEMEVQDVFGCAFPYSIRAAYACDAIMPNVFFAGNQGINGNFSWASPCPVSDFQISIYDRWGNLLFVSNDVEGVWSGDNAVPGVYTYYMKYTDGQGPVTKTGDVTLIK
ncbi:MAG: gliding motility-associated C-terminal domain-containing protein [Saprospiraceae bacterium]|nr:gliding motility-associated C-terminal domain-containing protein [Saprospiraceae bacterium]